MSEELKPATFTELLLNVLGCWNDARRGCAVTDLRTCDGWGHERQQYQPPFTRVPALLVQSLLDGWSVRLTPALRESDDRTLTDLPMLFTFWRPETAHNLEQGHHVVESAKAKIAAALATMPPPTVLVDAGPEVWAGWKLNTPIAWHLAQRWLTDLAEQLGSDASAFEHQRSLGELTLPIAGVIRNWNSLDREFVSIIEADATRSFTLDELTKEKRTTHDEGRIPAGLVEATNSGRGRSRPATQRA